MRTELLRTVKNYYYYITAITITVITAITITITVKNCLYISFSVYNK